MAEDSLNDTKIYQNPDEHPIFESFYNKENFIEGIWYNHLVGIFVAGLGTKIYSDFDINDIYHQVAVNIIVHAFIREKSIAKMYINSD